MCGARLRIQLTRERGARRTVGMSSAEEKELFAGVKEVIEGRNPQGIRATRHGQLYQAAVTEANSPFDTESAQSVLPSPKDAQVLVAFLPRQALIRNANVLLQCDRSDPESMCVYKYAMLLFADAQRVGSHRTFGLKYQLPTDDVDPEAAGPPQKCYARVHAAVNVMECLYDADNVLVGWYIYAYRNIKPPAEKKKPKTKSKSKKKRSFGAVSARLQPHVERALKRARVFLEADEQQQLEHHLESLEPEIRFNVIAQLDSQAGGEPGGDDDEDPAVAAVPPAGGGNGDQGSNEEEDKEQPADDDQNVDDDDVATPVASATGMNRLGSWDWMEALVSRTDAVTRIARTNAESRLWADANITPVDSDDIKTAWCTVAQRAKHHHDPTVDEVFKQASRFEPFRADNVIDHVAPRVMYSMQMAILLKRSYLGAATLRDEEDDDDDEDAKGDAKGGREMTLAEELAMHGVLSNGDYPVPGYPYNALRLRGTASRITHGLFRMTLLDVRAIARAFELSRDHLLDAQQPSARNAAKGAYTDLTSWHEFVSKVAAYMRTVSVDASVPARLQHALRWVPAFDTHWAEFTPGLGALSHVVRYFTEHNADGTLLTRLRVPFDDDVNFNDTGCAPALQWFGRLTASVAANINNKHNFSIIAQELRVILDAPRYEIGSHVPAGQSALLVHGLAGKGKTVATTYVTQMAIPGMVSLFNRETAATGFGGGDSFNRVVYRDEAHASACGASPDFMTNERIVRIARGTGFAAEPVSEQWDLRKGRMSTNVSTVNTASVQTGNKRLDVVTQAVVVDSNLFTVNFSWAAISQTGATRCPQVRRRTRY